MCTRARAGVHTLTDRCCRCCPAVWDCGASFPFKTKTTIQYPKHTDLELSLKRFEVTTFGVLKVHDGQIVSHEQRSDFFRPVPLPTVAL